MGLFGKKKERAAAGAEGARVQMMGTGCKKCHELYEAASEALAKDSVEYVTDMVCIAEAGVMTLPELVVDGKVVSAGKVIAPDGVRKLAREQQ